MPCPCGVGMLEVDVQALIDAAITGVPRPGPTVMVTTENAGGTTQDVAWRRQTTAGVPGVFEWFDEFGFPTAAPVGVFAPGPIRVAAVDTATGTWADDLMTLWGLTAPVDFDVFDAAGNDFPHRMLRAPSGTWIGVGLEEADVPNVAALRVGSADFKAAGAVRPRRHVASHTNPGDGGGGWFRWDPASVVADDNGWHIDPGGAAAGRWVREGFTVTPHMFGAQGSHRTPAAARAGADQLPAIQSMLTLWASRDDLLADFLGLHWHVSGPVLLTSNVAPKTTTRGPRLNAGTFVASTASSGDALVQVRMPHGQITGRLGAVGTGGISMASRTWRSGVWLAHALYCSVDQITTQFFRRYGVDAIEEPGGSNIGYDIGVINAWYAGPCDPTHPNAGIGISLSSAFTANTRIGSANSIGQGSTLTLTAPPPPELAVSDVVLIATTLDLLEPHWVKSIVGNDVTVFPWVDAATTAGQINYSFGAAVHVAGGEAASGNIRLVEALSSATALHHAALYGPTVQGLQAQFCTTTFTYGGNDGTSGVASLMGSIEQFYSEGSTATKWAIIGLSSSSNCTGFRVPSGLYMGGDGANSHLTDPYGGMWQIGPKDGSAVGLRTSTLNTLNGVTLQELDGSHVPKRLGSRAGQQPATATLSNRPGRDSFVTHANAVTLTLEWDASLDRNRAGHTRVEAIISGTAAGNAPTGNVTVQLAAADIAAGVTLNGGIVPVVVAGGALGAPMQVNALMVVAGAAAGAARDWKLFTRAL